jgi:hypothetical protein
MLLGVGLVLGTQARSFVPLGAAASERGGDSRASLWAASHMHQQLLGCVYECIRCGIGEAGGGVSIEFVHIVLPPSAFSPHKAPVHGLQLIDCHHHHPSCTLVVAGVRSAHTSHARCGVVSCNSSWHTHVAIVCSSHGRRRHSSSWPAGCEGHPV